MRFSCIFIILLTSVNSFSQPIVVHKYGDTIIYHRRHISLGVKHDGIGFGNFIYYNGLKLSFFDKDTLTNGISVSISQWRQPKKTNGVELAANVTLSKVNGVALGFINSVYVELRGLSLAVLYDYNFKTSGVALCGLLRMNDYLNGVSIAGIADVHHRVKGFTLVGAYEYADSLSGVSISGITINSDNCDGLAISAINTTTTGHGVQIGIFNEADDYKGVQIGLININKSKKHFKVLPFVNFR